MWWNCCISSACEIIFLSWGFCTSTWDCPKKHEYQGKTPSSDHQKQSKRTPRASEMKIYKGNPLNWSKLQISWMVSKQKLHVKQRISHYAHGIEKMLRDNFIQTDNRFLWETCLTIDSNKRVSVYFGAQFIVLTSLTWHNDRPCFLKNNVKSDRKPNRKTS